MEKKSNFRLNSIRTKIFIVLFCFVGFAIILLSVSAHFNSEKEKINKKVLKVQQLDNKIIKASYYQNQFFINDLHKPDFYVKNKSLFIEKYNRELEKCKKAIQKLKKKKSPAEKGNDLIAHVENDLQKIDKYFNMILRMQKRRGFKDHGMEGRMRKYAHAMENASPNTELKTSLLQLRRHEKDYFLRCDTSYAELLRLEASKMEIQIKHLPALTQTLHQYTQCFDSIVKADELIGIKRRSGYKALLDIYNSQIENSLDDLNAYYKNYHKKSTAEINELFISVCIVLIILALIVCLLVASSITRRIRILSDFMQQYVRNRFVIRNTLDPGISKDEISDLYKSFHILQTEISVHFQKYKDKVEKRTREIEDQKKIIEEKNIVLVQQKNVLDFQNQHILSSLKAAKRLQDSLFPRESKMKEVLGDYFLKFEPLDIVSGDFYWIEKTNKGKYIAVADCTGHGAQGALMSIMAFNILNHALKDKGLIHPYEILNYLSAKINELFTRKNLNESMKDSLDIALIRIHNDQLYFAGAQRDVFIQRKNEIITLHSDRKPIGWVDNDDMFNFSGQVFSLRSGDRIFMMTDGITDQFGGAKNKKFKRSFLLKLLEEFSTGSFQQQCYTVNEIFNQWKFDTEQTDDITLLAFEIGEIPVNAYTDEEEVSHIHALIAGI